MFVSAGVGVAVGVGVHVDVAVGVAVLVGFGVSVATYLYPRIRLVEDELPDAIADHALDPSAAAVQTATDLEPVPASTG